MEGYWLLFFSVWLGLQISRRRWHRSAWNFVGRYISVPDRSSSLLGAVPPGSPNPKLWPYILATWPRISRTVSRSVTCQYSLTSAWRRLSKNVSHGAVATRRVHSSPRLAGLCVADALVFLCPVTDISATVALWIGVKFCMMVHIDPGQIVSPFGGSALSNTQNPKFWV